MAADTKGSYAIVLSLDQDEAALVSAALIVMAQAAADADLMLRATRLADRVLNLSEGNG